MDPYIQAVMTIGVPTLAILTGILINNSRLGEFRSYMDTRFNDMDSRFGERFNGIDRRFDNVDRQLTDMKELWRSELHRVEEILDARLKHLEEN